jgi:short-subunit dehydrogenase
MNLNPRDTHMKRRVALSTGGSKGIGLGIAKALARRDHDLVLVARNEHDLETARTELKRLHPSIEIHTISADLSQPEGYARINSLLEKHYGQLDVHVNNAGDFKMLPAESDGVKREAPQQLAHDITAMYLVNALPPSVFAFTLRNLQLAAPAPKQLDVLSSAALEIFPGNNPYGPTKSAHERLSLQVVADTAGAIRTYRVYPSNTNTRIVAGFSVPKMTPEEVGEAAIAMLEDDTATDLYMKMTAQGLITATARVSYTTHARDGLSLVEAHREALARDILPIVREGLCRKS